MTVGDIKRMLDKYPDDTPAIFMPQEFCSQGYPIWQDAFTAENGCDDIKGITIMLVGEAE